MLAAVLVVHLAALWAGLFLARILGLPRPDQIAVAFAGSQKTLMVGLIVAISLQTTILPMVAYQVLQLLADTLIADRLLPARSTKLEKTGGIDPATRLPPRYLEEAH